MRQHIEARLEDAIVYALCEGGGYRLIDYRQGEAAGRFDKARALDAAELMSFIQQTQARTWDALHAVHGPETERIVIDHLVKELDTKTPLCWTSATSPRRSSRLSSPTTKTRRPNH